jgi:hypothetical protein
MSPATASAGDVDVLLELLGVDTGRGHVSPPARLGVLMVALAALTACSSAQRHRQPSRGLRPRWRPSGGARSAERRDQ